VGLSSERSFNDLHRRTGTRWPSARQIEQRDITGEFETSEPGISARHIDRARVPGCLRTVRDYFSA
jgi:hypothetical protein